MFESCQIFRGDVWLTQQTGSSNWIKISLLSFHGSLPWFQRCRELSASGLFQKQLLWDSTCYFHAEQEEKQEGGCVSLQANPNTHTYTYFYNPECIQCPNWYYNPAERGGMKKGTVLKWCHFPVFHSSLLISTATVLPYIQEPVWRNSVWEQNHLYYLSNVVLFYNIIIVAERCSFSVWTRAG